MYDCKVSMISCCKSDSVLCLVTAEVLVVVAIPAVARLLCCWLLLVLRSKVGMTLNLAAGQHWADTALDDADIAPS